MCAEQTHEPVKSHVGAHFTLDAYDLSAGFMQFVQSVPVAEVLATEGNIQVTQYFKSCQNGTYLLVLDLLNTFFYVCLKKSLMSLYFSWLICLHVEFLPEARSE